MFLKHLLTLIISMISLVIILTGCSEDVEPLTSKYGNYNSQTEESITGTIIDATAEIITDNVLSNTIINGDSSEILISTLNTLIPLMNDLNKEKVSVHTEQIFFSVEYDRSRDGDTAEFLISENAYKLVVSENAASSENNKFKFDKVKLSDVSNFKKGQRITIRSLLIDTPELSDNQPYSKEALAFAHEQLANAESILVAYDKGE